MKYIMSGHIVIWCSNSCCPTVILYSITTIPLQRNRTWRSWEPLSPKKHWITESFGFLRWNFEGRLTSPHLSRVRCHMSCVTCQVSYVMCHVSPVTCHLSPAICHVSKKNLYKVVRLKGAPAKMRPPETLTNADFKVLYRKIFFLWQHQCIFKKKN